MLEKKFTNKDLGIELNSYIDKQQNVWFRGKDVAVILGYSKTRDALSRHVENEDKQQIFTRHPRGPKTGPVAKSHTSVHKTWTAAPSGSMCTYINESGFYSLVLSSKLETAKKFKHWISSQVLPSIRKYGYYKMFDNPNNKMFKIENEMDLHSKVVHLIRNFYPDAIMVPGLGENQDTPEKRINSWKKGYLRGTPDLMILNYHKDYNGLCIEFKSPTNYYEISDAQKEMKERYKINCYKFILSNDYDYICKRLHKYMEGIRIPCKYCSKAFCNKETLNNHYKVIHRIEKNINQLEKEY